MFKKGLAYSFPIVIGYLPVAVTFGVVATAVGFSKLETLMASALIFAGASQFALVSILPESFLAGIAVPVALNLRHLVYSSIISQQVRMRSPLITAFGLTDEVFATSLNSPKDERFMWGLELGAYSAWVLGTLLGVYAGSFLISYQNLYSSLVFSLTALFLVLLLPNLKGKHAISAVFGGMIALLFHYLGQTSAGIIAAGIVAPLAVKMIER